MESRVLLQSIRERGLAIKAIGADILLSPKNLINDKVISLIREYKEKLLTILYQEQDEAHTPHPEPKHFLNLLLTCKCGYRPPFCSCGGVPIPGMVSCALCANFEPDTIGNGSGIGLCKKGILWTEQANRRTPLYRNTWRHCREFDQTPKGDKLNG